MVFFLCVDKMSFRYQQVLFWFFWWSVICQSAVNPVNQTCLCNTDHWHYLRVAVSLKTMHEHKDNRAWWSRQWSIPLRETIHHRRLIDNVQDSLQKIDLQCSSMYFLLSTFGQKNLCSLGLFFLSFFFSPIIMCVRVSFCWGLLDMVIEFNFLFRLNKKLFIILILISRCLILLRLVFISPPVAMVWSTGLY